MSTGTDSKQGQGGPPGRMGMLVAVVAVTAVALWVWAWQDARRFRHDMEQVQRQVDQRAHDLAAAADRTRHLLRLDRPAAVGTPLLEQLREAASARGLSETARGGAAAADAAADDNPLTLTVTGDADAMLAWLAEVERVAADRVDRVRLQSKAEAPTADDAPLRAELDLQPWGNGR